MKKSKKDIQQELNQRIDIASVGYTLEDLMAQFAYRLSIIAHEVEMPLEVLQDYLGSMYEAILNPRECKDKE